MASDPAGAARTEEARQAAQVETDKALAGLDGPRPESVWSPPFTVFPVEELIKAASDADMIVLGSRGAGSFTRLLTGSVAGQVASTRIARSSSFP
jgi:nucleotide-binding universal stress UspA family protein